MRKRAWVIGGVLLLAAISVFAASRSLNRYQEEGRVAIQGLEAPVTVIRDEKGMASIHAQSLEDALLAWGFVTAQDRLFQMELTRLFACGRLSELAGEAARDLDVRMRTLGFRRNAARHAGMLDDETQHAFQRYIQGVNAYITTRRDTHPLEFSLAGIQPEPWTVADCLAIFYYMSWDTAANLQTEIVAQMLVDTLGAERAREIFPLNINPDDSGEGVSLERACIQPAGEPLRVTSDDRLMALLKDRRLEIGSNNWAVGPDRGRRGRPMVANDPHLDARILPGPWYPVCLVTSKHRVAGVHIPGLPAMPILRNAHVAMGITNAYGDAQDLYIETLDPANPDCYLEGERSVPFQVIEETIRIKDKDSSQGIRAETVRIRCTHRGPVVSNVLPGLESDRLITIRWAPFETMGPSLGMDRLLRAESVWDVRNALEDVRGIMLNFVFADMEGNIGWHASGRIPIRSAGDGTLPFPVTDGKDNWSGWIPYHEMPHAYNPSRGWVGTANHAVTSRDYPYYYSSRQAPSYRYRRIKELLAAPGTRSAEDLWAYQQDTRNVMAEQIVPILVGALKGREETADMARVLEGWDFREEPDQAAPTLFHEIYERVAFLTFQDDLGDDRARLMLSDWYFWQERFQRMMQDKDADWFDDKAASGV
ncbi:MAG: penicillin acylase family protein, partial [Desulfobacteraceae bacterium]